VPPVNSSMNKNVEEIKYFDYIDFPNLIVFKWESDLWKILLEQLEVNNELTGEIQLTLSKHLSYILCTHQTDQTIP